MTFYDISRTLNSQIAVWEGDTPFQLATVLERSQGASVNLTTLTLSTHTGTHLDAPRHFTDAGITIDQVDLLPYWGKAQVITLDKEKGALMPADFAGISLQAPRILIHSHCSHLEPAYFPTDILYPSAELAAYLGKKGVILFGSDAPSMDDVQSKDLPGHNALHQHGIAILEGVDLSQVPDGLYELVALPLKIEGGDGSPVRAVLRSL